MQVRMCTTLHPSYPIYISTVAKKHGVKKSQNCKCKTSHNELNRCHPWTILLFCKAAMFVLSTRNITNTSNMGHSLSFSLGDVICRRNLSIFIKFMLKIKGILENKIVSPKLRRKSWITIQRHQQ